MAGLIVQYTYDELTSDGFDYQTALSDLSVKKKRFQDSGDEASANEVWRQGQRVKIFQLFATMHKQLQDEEYYESWCTADRIDIKAGFLLRNFPQDTDMIGSLLDRVHDYQKMFPYRLFTSTVMREKTVRCTICGQEVTPWSTCTHEVGKVYNGELCCREIADFDLLGADIVTNPQHKYAVAFLSNGKVGGRQDNYDYSVLKELRKLWLKPFQPWSCKATTIYRPVPKGTKDNDLCPCYSKPNSYKDCCKGKPGIESLRFTISFQE